MVRGRELREDPTTGDFPESTSFGVRAGRYLNANTTLELSFSRSEQEDTIACALRGAPLAVDVEVDAVDLEVFHVRRSAR